MNMIMMKSTYQQKIKICHSLVLIMLTSTLDNPNFHQIIVSLYVQSKRLIKNNILIPNGERISKGVIEEILAEQFNMMSLMSS